MAKVSVHDLNVTKLCDDCGSEETFPAKGTLLRVFHCGQEWEILTIEYQDPLLKKHMHGNALEKAVLSMVFRILKRCKNEVGGTFRDLEYSSAQYKVEFLMGERECQS